MKKLFLSLLALVLTVCAEAQVIQIMNGDELVEQIRANAFTRVVFSEQPAYVAVDLGLSVKWATFNVGAVNTWEPGDCFAWGETVPKSSSGSWETYFDTTDGGTTFATFHNGDGGMTVLDADHDVAHVTWGGNWRMPTKEEWNELLLSNDKCEYTTVSIRGMKGMKVTSKVNGNAIFLPYAADGSGDSGKYWSSSLSSADDGKTIDAKAFAFAFSDDHVASPANYRTSVYSVRPVCE